MQEKRTLYLAGKITGDPYYFTKFYNAQKKLEEGGFIVVNPALLPAEGFTWEAYMRMSGAMLAECAEVCFLPDWKESKGAKYEFGEAMAHLLRRLGEGARRNEQIRIHDRENRQDRFSMLRMRKNQRLSGNTRRWEHLQILRRRIKGDWIRKENGGIAECRKIKCPFRRKRKSK